MRDLKVDLDACLSYGKIILERKKYSQIGQIKKKNIQILFECSSHYFIRFHHTFIQSAAPEKENHSVV